MKNFTKMFKFALLLAVFAFTAPAQVDRCSDFQALVKKTYNFKPSEISPSARADKSNEMDKVWEMVKAEKEVLIPCLKKAISKQDVNEFFAFDASNLLFSLENNKESKKIMIDSYSKVDIKDVDPSYWIRVIGALGFEGFDTSAAGVNWLRAKDPSFYMAEHGAQKVTKEAGLLIIFGSMDEAFATPVLARISLDPKHDARFSAMNLLFQQLTSESFKVVGEIISVFESQVKTDAVFRIMKNIPQISPREGEPKTTREEYLKALNELAEGRPNSFLELTVKFTDGEKDAVAVLGKEDIPLIRKSRRFFAATANPHSAEWYQSFTGIIVAIDKKDDKNGAVKKKLTRVLSITVQESD